MSAHTATQTTARAGHGYAPPVSKQALIAEAIGCILAGRAYPANLATPAARADDCPPSCCEEGIGRILAGPARSPVA